ncbi:MAG: 30S ribosome-binding factor RbfA [Bacteroidales bacterium]
MESVRQQRVARLIQRDLGEIFQRETRDRFGNVLITVTKVHVTRDLAIAHVYLSLLMKGDKKAMIEKISSQSGEIRYHLGLKIGKQVRVVPELRFHEDDSLDYIDRIDSLLNNPSD